MSYNPEQDGQFKQQTDLKAPQNLSWMHCSIAEKGACVLWCGAVSIVSLEPLFSDFAARHTTCPSMSLTCFRIPTAATSGQGAMETSRWMEATDGM